MIWKPIASLPSDIVNCLVLTKDGDIFDAYKETKVWYAPDPSGGGYYVINSEIVSWDYREDGLL